MLKELTVGKKIDFGEVVLSEQEIIDFAKLFDPLDFHTDKELAKTTIFKGLIASGPHLFNVFYQRKWIPLFGKSVICGMSVSNWKFIKPVYANRKTSCIITVLDMKQDKDIGGTAIEWLYEFKNEKGDMV